MIWLAVRRPITTLTATAALAVLGATSLVRVPLDLLPQVDLPRLEVHVAWMGASPEMVESLVTARVEAVAQGVGGVKSVTSTSYPERAVVTVEFARGTDMEFARLELSERLAALARSLPPGADRPLVEPYVPDAFAINNQALLSDALVGPSTIGGLRELAIQRVEPAIRAVEGVDEVETVGGTDRELQVRLDPIRLAAHSLAPSDVRDAIATGLNLAGSGATIRRHDREWTIAIADRANRVSDVETLVLRRETSSSAALRLGDVADVAFSYAEQRSHYRVDGEPAVTLFMHAEAGSNAIQVADRVRERMAELVPELPSGFQLIEDHDRTKKIRFEMSRLRDRALIAAAVVLLVLALAFRRLAPALIACGSVAASILTAIGLLRIGGLSLNLLTLAGLAMGIGLVVDNAIVVLERIEARRTQGEQAIAAAAHGAREVALPVLAATATTLIVFVPFLYAQGELRVYYVPFAWTVVAVLAVSLAIALTVVPTLAARTGFGPSADPRGGKGRRGNVVKPSLPQRGFRETIVWTLRHPRTTVSAAFVALVLSGWLFWDRVPRGRIWGEPGDETFLSIQIEMPRGSELDHTDRITQGLEERLGRIPEVERYVTRVQSEFGHIRASFPDNLTTTEIPAEIKERLVAYSREYGGTEVRVYGFGPSFYGGSGGTPSYSLKLLGYDYRELERLASDLAARLRSFPRIRDVNPNASGLWFERDQETELVLAPDRSRLAAYGVSVSEFLDRAAIAIQGRITRDRVEIAGREVSLDVKVDRAHETDVEDLLALVVTGPEGRPIRIADVAVIHPRETLARIVRDDQRYQRIVAWEFRGPSKLGDRVRDAVLSSTALPAGYEIEVERSWWEADPEETRQLLLVVGLAVTLVYLVTAGLFESLRAPLVVLAAVPQALVGVFVLYWALGETFTREAWIGVVMMSGIVVNNAILIVDRIGVLARGGVGAPFTLREAALEGTLDRVRPVLMTTATTVLGLLPLSVSEGEGASTLWRALTLTTIGGLIASTVLVLTTIPALYLIVMTRTAEQEAARRIAHV